MQVRVVIRDAQGEENFELRGDLSTRQVENLDRVAEQVAHETGWAVTLTTEELG